MQLLRGIFEQAKRKVKFYYLSKLEGRRMIKLEPICLKFCSHLSLSTHSEMEKVPGWKSDRNRFES